MAVNESVYGAANTWANAYYQQNSIANKNKIANFGDNTYTLAQGVSKGKLSYTEGIDKSISFCGLGTESALSHIAFIARTSSNTAEVLTENNRDVTNFGFFERVDNSMIFTSTDYRTNETSKYVWGNYSNTDNFTKTLRPLTLVNPHNLVLCIYVRCGQAGYNNTENMTLKTYLQSYTTSRPRIYKVWVQPYFGDTIPRLTEAGQGTPGYRKPLQIGLLDEYDFTAKNLKFNSYQLQTNNVIFGSFASGDYFYNMAESFSVVAFTPNSKEHLKIEYNNDLYFPYFDYYAGFEEDILKTTACFGLYFTTDNNVAQSGALTHNDMYIGILDNQGVGHGQYFRGADTARAPQAANDFIDMSKAGYDPSTPYINYDTSSHYGILSYYNFNKMYSISNEQVELLYRELTAAMSAKPNDMTETDYSKGTFLTNDPIDCIISLRKYPITSTTSSSAVHDIYFGGYQSALSAPYANNAETIRYEFTGTKAFISKYGGGFLDKEGYTTAELFIPFCGTVKLPVNEFIDRTLSVKLIVDYLTGTCTAYVELDGIPRITINGSIGVDVPVTGIQTNELQNTINRNIANLKTAQITAGMTARSGASIATGSGSASSAIMSAVNMINPLAIANKMDSTEKALISRDLAEYNLYHTEIPFKAVSAGDALTAGFGEWRCRLSITRPVLSQNYIDDPSVYAKTIGYACLKSGKVSDFSGLTVGTIDLSGINCTDKEKAMIIQAFKSGVYL